MLMFIFGIIAIFFVALTMFIMFGGYSYSKTTIRILFFLGFVFLGLTFAFIGK
jgi:hypothetical protein